MIQQPRIAGNEFAHARHSDTLRDLLAGWQMFAAFIVESELVAEQQAKQLLTKIEQDLRTLFDEQIDSIHATDECEIFLDGLRDCLAAGRAHLMPKDGVTGMSAMAYRMDSRYVIRPPWDSMGWRIDSDRNLVEPKGGQIGWYDRETDEIYLIPDIVLKTVREVRRDIAFSDRTLWARLRESGYIFKHDYEKNRARNTLKLRINNERKRVVCISKTTLWPD
jgi:hypothetical protein